MEYAGCLHDLPLTILVKKKVKCYVRDLLLFLGLSML